MFDVVTLLRHWRLSHLSLWKSAREGTLGTHLGDNARESRCHWRLRRSLGNKRSAVDGLCRVAAFNSQQANTPT